MWKIEYIFSAISQNEFVGGKLNFCWLTHGEREYVSLAAAMKALL